MLGILLVFIGACSYGILSTFVTFAYQDGFTVNEVVGSQMFFGCLLTWALALCFKGGRAAKKDWLALFGVGATVAATGIFYYMCLQFVSASIAIVLLFQFTWIGILIDALSKRAIPPKEELIALLLLVIGTVLAGGVFNSEQHLSFLGIVLGLLAALSYALFILFSGRVSLHVNPWRRSAIVMSGSLLLAFIVYPPTFLWSGALGDGLLLWGGLLALFVVVSTVCFTIGVPRIDAGLAIILSSAELPTAVVMSRYVLQENVHLLQWIGVAIILLGIAVPEIYRSKTGSGAVGRS